MMSHFHGKDSGASGRGISLYIGGGMFRKTEFLAVKMMMSLNEGCVAESQEQAAGIQAGLKDTQRVQSRGPCKRQQQQQGASSAWGEVQVV